MYIPLPFPSPSPFSNWGSSSWKRVRKWKEMLHSRPQFRLNTSAPFSQPKICYTGTVLGGGVGDSVGVSWGQNPEPLELLGSHSATVLLPSLRRWL